MARRIAANIAKLPELLAKDLMSAQCYNYVIFTEASNHDCSSDFRQMSAKRPQHCLSRHRSDLNVNYAASSLSQRWTFASFGRLGGFAGTGSERNGFTQRANDRNFERGLWREAVQRSEYPSMSRPCRFWQLSARRIAANIAKLPELSSEDLIGAQRVT